METFDVVVIGAGPAGSMAAKKCAEEGLRTLLLEKKKLPRRKPCSGLVMNRMGQKLLKDEFGEMPREIVLDVLSGLILWAPGAGQHEGKFAIPITWRKELDFWMNQKAREKGVEIWDESRVKGLCAEVAKEQRRMAVWDSSGICVFGRYGVSEELERKILAAGTGIEEFEEMEFS